MLSVRHLSIQHRQDLRPLVDDLSFTVSGQDRLAIIGEESKDDALEKLAKVFEDMLELAQVEKTMQLLAEEIEKTRRRVNALEHVIIPETEKNIKFITMKLDENERANTIRLMKVKDMILKEAILEQRAADAEVLRESGQPS